MFDEAILEMLDVPDTLRELKNDLFVTHKLFVFEFETTLRTGTASDPVTLQVVTFTRGATRLVLRFARAVLREGIRSDPVTLHVVTFTRGVTRLVLMLAVVMFAKGLVIFTVAVTL